jgi:sterol desaturase/sphingolipid hydroxylase (fatty acid hydroxylase superfamily)
MIFAEAIVSAWKNHRFYEARDTLGTLGMFGGNVVMAGLFQGSSFALYLYLYHYVSPIRINDLLPVWAVWVLTFAAIDLNFYCWHRTSHRVRVLWAQHMNHHCSTEMNFTVAFRQPWLAPLFKIPFFAALPLLGFDPTITVVAGVVSTLWGVVGHTRWIGKLGPLEWVFNTPSHHRVHHGSNPEYVDKNYGNLLIIWDRLLGTFAEEREPVVYGLIKNVDTQNPLTLTVMIWHKMLVDLRSSVSFGDGLAYVFGPPGWRPQASAGADALDSPD